MFAVELFILIFWRYLVLDGVWVGGGAKSYLVVSFAGSMINFQVLKLISFSMKKIVSSRYVS